MNARGRRQRSPRPTSRTLLDHNNRLCLTILSTSLRWSSRPLRRPKRSRHTSTTARTRIRPRRARDHTPTIPCLPSDSSRCHTTRPTSRPPHIRLDRARLPSKALHFPTHDLQRQRPDPHRASAALRRLRYREDRRAEVTSRAPIPRRKWRVRCSRTSNTRRRISILAVVTATAHSRSQVAPRARAGRTCSRQWRKLPPRRGRQAHITRIPINARNQFILSRTHRRRPRPRVSTRPLDRLHSTTRRSNRSRGSNKGALSPPTDRPFLLINNRRKRHRLPPRYPHPHASRRIFRSALATLPARIPSGCPRSDPPFPSSSSRNRHRNCIPSSNRRRPRRGPLPRCRVDCRAHIHLPSSTIRSSERPSLEATASVASA